MLNPTQISFNTAELVADGGLDCVMNFQVILFMQGIHTWHFSTPQSLWCLYLPLKTPADIS